MRVALAVPLEAERRLSASAGYHGHEIVAVESGGDGLALQIPLREIDLVLVAATPEHLTRRLIDTADTHGVRMLVVAADAEGSRHAVRLGVVDSVDGQLDWSLLGGAAPTAVDAAVPMAADAAWPLQHPLFAAFGWCLGIVAVLVPLTVRRYVTTR